MTDFRHPSDRDDHPSASITCLPSPLPYIQDVPLEAPKIEIAKKRQKMASAKSVVKKNPKKRLEDPPILWPAISWNHKLAIARVKASCDRWLGRQNRKKYVGKFGRKNILEKLARKRFWIFL